MPMFKKGRERMMSTVSIAANKGLLNEPGENNCFLNSAIQVLWHLDVFRRSFRTLHGHACMGPSCIFCALKDIFQQFQHSKAQALPPNVLRSALAETFQQQNRFQMGFMDDAAECFENILLRLHVHIGNTVREDVCTASHCIPHQKFGLSLVEQCVCSSCGATSEPLPFIEMVHYVSATALCTEDEYTRHRYGTSASSQMFGKLVRVAGGWGEKRSCPSECGARVDMRKVLMNCPDVVSIGIVWDSEVPQVQNIIDLVHALGTTLRLADLFHTVVDERASQMELYLVGMVCYYGKHYSTFFFHTKLRKWVYFDDAQVSEVGKRWINVVDKCIKGHHQPLLLLYANPNATTISNATAPKDITMLPGYMDQLNGGYDYASNIPPVKEVDSLSSDSASFAEEENSGTESMQATSIPTAPPARSKPESKPPQHIVQPHQASTRPVEKSHGKKSAVKSDPKPVSIGKSPPAPKPTPVLSAPKPLPVALPNPIQPEQVVRVRKPATSEAAPVEVQPKKPMFQWKMASEKTQNTGVKVGHYVEPQPATWTKYKPYPQGKKVYIQRPKVEANPLPPSQSPLQQQTKDVSVVAVESQGMASFAITSRQSDASSSANSTPHQTPPKQHVASRNSVDKTDRQSPVSKLRRTSQTSASSIGTVSLASSHAESIASRPTVPSPVPSLAERPQQATKPELNPPEAVQSKTEQPTDPVQNEKAVLLLRDAEDRFEQSRLADTRMDYSTALQLCLEATKLIETVLLMQDVPTQCMLRARIKHGECVNKARILQRRKNIRMKARDQEVVGDRSSMTEADRHMTQATNSVPASVEYEDGKVDLVKEMETKDDQNLINFDKPGVTSLQHQVNQIYENHNQLRSHPEYRPPVGLVPKQPPVASNANNNNSSNVSDIKRSQSPAPSNSSDPGGETSQERTKIFVWKRPEDEEDAVEVKGRRRPPSQGTMTPNVSSPNVRAPPEDRNPRRLVSESNLRGPHPRDATINKKSSSGSVDREIEDNMKTMTLNPSHRFRSRTPTPQAGNDVVPISQHRRSKTPTPMSNKELMRLRHTNRGPANDQRQRPKSAYSGGTSSDSQKSEDLTENGPVAPPRRRSNKSNSDTESPTAERPSSAMGIPFAYPAWQQQNNAMMSMPYNPAMFSPTYYPYMYEMWQYYNSLTPEQKKVLSAMPMANQPQIFPVSSPMTAPSTMKAAYLENLKIQLGKNLRNFTNSIDKIPDPNRNNTNIYEANKPKPVGKSEPDTRPQRDSLNRSARMPSRRPPVESRPNSKYGPQRPGTTSPPQPPNSGFQGRRPDQDAKHHHQQNHPNPQSSSSSHTKLQNPEINRSTREGMMKWADEAKKRAPGPGIPPEFRSKLIHDFANRSRRGEPPAGVANNSGAVPSGGKPVSGAPSSGSGGDHECELCGLVKVPPSAKYCASCKAYLSRFKPTVNSIRSGEKTTT
uniref:Inactive ubiquitin carboxyl-terminal hydrolase 54-like n=1 Tax=Phallusia mammillata TaxID=59560 RepID=A0A6F9DX03_9ASCI|nr:inactive ubiquitin carboxyl-terminal hydrolase 54-like [Phallusia mammillata]